MLISDCRRTGQAATGDTQRENANAPRQAPVAGCRLPVSSCLRAIASLAFIALTGCNVGIAEDQGYEPAQPIEYSHSLHAGEHRLPCLYCHFGAEKSRHAGIPPASVCMNCHLQIKPRAPLIEKIATAMREDRPIEWVRIHQLPDFVYFNHARHVGRGVECQSCHGPVESMVRVKQFAPLNMGWCVDCHRKTLADPTNAGRLSPPLDCAPCHH